MEGLGSRVGHCVRRVGPIFEKNAHFAICGGGQHGGAPWRGRQKGG